MRRLRLAPGLGLALALLLMVVALPIAAAANPMETLDRSVDRTAKDGYIAEMVAAGPYTYARVGLGQGDDYEERWVVAMRGGLEEGDVVRVTPMGVRRDYTSKRTGLAFEELWFATVKLID